MPKSRLIAPGIFQMVMVFLVLFELMPGLRAQDKPVPESAPAPLDSTNRFLFVLDTSAFMRKHTQDVVNVVETILRSSASGQLHNGDTIGVWTFNDDIYTGAMPLETWSADNSEEIALRIAEFIRQQDYGKSSRLDIAMKPVARVVKMSDIITAFIISSGAGPISGTPYDDDINAQYQACLHDMGKKPMPIVTVLQGKHGKFIRYTVNALPWPVVIPELPIPLKLPDAQPAAPAPAVTSAPPAAANPSVAANTAPPPPPVIPTPVLPPPAVAPPAVVPPAEFRPPASVVSTGPPPAIPSQFAPSVPVAQSASPPPPPPPAEVPAPAPTPAPTPTPVVEPPVAQTASVTPAPQPEPVVKPATSAQLPLVPPRQPPLVPKTLPANAALAENTAPPVAPVPAPQPASTQPATAPTAATSQNAPAPATPAPVPPKTLVAQASALVKSFTGAHRSVLLIGGISLLVVASALILLMARRPRPRTRVSLITQTMDERRR